MSAKGGPANVNAGPHLPFGGPLDDLAADPANGERVPRCYVCGIPERRVFGLFEHGTYRAAIRVCERCLWRLQSA